MTADRTKLSAGTGGPDPLAGHAAALARAEHGDPFAVLGPHPDGQRTSIRAYQPGARSVSVVDPVSGEVLARLDRRPGSDLFEGTVPREWPFSYRLRVEGDHDAAEIEDPYRFPPILGEVDVYLLAEGRHLRLYEKLGAHPSTHEGVEGTSFAVWAPSARSVSVVGSFNGWDGRRHPMRKRIECGVWELFLPGVGAGEPYKFEIKGPQGELLPLKADPVALRSERPPATASITHGLPRREWQDAGWLRRRAGTSGRDAPISVYECHLGSWMRGDGNRYLTYDELAERLVPYVKEMGFTHLELLPVSEFPFDGSWGYQPIGLFAPTSRFGTPEQFAAFVDRCHREGIGVIIDWVPGHFPTDAHGLARFDGTHLYEHADPRQGFHRDWNTLIYNYGRTEVTNFLIANGLFWLDQYHVDALRVDAVASMLYLDYSREPGDWVPNRFGGNENLEAIEFLKRLNELAFADYPGATTIAEESTSWPGVSRPTYLGGLGFGYKWNMGWMHDSLEYITKDPIHRRWHHHQLTFGLLYAFSENFVLPLSHDEVVHGKGSLWGKMPGDEWQKAANLRAYFGFMWGHPGKKLLFMGGEFGQHREWNHDSSLDWHLLENRRHSGIQSLVRDLNAAYRTHPALHERDCEPEGFEWIESNDNENCVFAFLRRGKPGSAPVIVVNNFTPIVRYDYRVGVPEPGHYRELLNTDSEIYGGSNVGNYGGVMAEPVPWHGRPYSVRLTLPPLATLYLQPES